MLNILPDAVVTTIGVPVTIHVLANDTGDGLNITSFVNPAHGSLVFNADRSFTYTPADGFMGQDTFSYTVRDAYGVAAGAEVAVNVVADNGHPETVDDYVEMVSGSAVVIPVLANDAAPEGGSLQIVAVTSPGHGTINILPDQTIRYVPQNGFVGIDSFTYTVADQHGATATATATMKVLSHNNPPLAVDDTFTVEAGLTTILAVLVNDTDHEGGPISVVGFTMPSHGSLVFNPDRTFSYTPDPGYVGSDHFTYTIRDPRGASATAQVTLVIVVASETPGAIDDHVTTEAGAPVVIDVLANDVLPETPQAGIIAVSLPSKGKLTFNADRTITYLPNSGFVGIDDFTYTIGNGQGETSKATVTIEVTPATAGTTYENGYAYRRRIVLPVQGADQSTVNDVVVMFAKEASWLKSAANGGKVASDEGFDLRFELTDGSKLDHEIESYDPVIGKLLAWVRLPSWKLSDQLQLLVYYGNPLVDEGDADLAGVWQGYLARWRLPDGSDATGQARDLVAQDVAAGELIGSAAALDGTGRLTLDDTSWLDGLSTLTVQALVKPDATMVGSSVRILAQGNDDAAVGVALGYMTETSGGFRNVVYATVGCTDGSASTFSRSDRQTNDRQLIHAQWQSSIAPRLYLNGSRAISSTSEARSGQTQSADGPIEVGRDWVGLIDEIRITDRALPSAWIATEARNMLSPELSYGLGQEETADTIEPPVVAVPCSVSTDTGKWVDIPVLSQIFAPGNTEAVDIVGISQPTNGTASVVGDAVRYTPANDFIGRDQLTYTISDGKTQSVGLIVVEVVDPVSQGQDDSNLPPGQNLLPNSKLLGEDMPTGGWYKPATDTGTLTFGTSSTEGHRNFRCQTGGGNDRARIGYDVPVESGKIYTLSVECEAIVSTIEGVAEVINWTPLANATPLSARPNAKDLQIGERVYVTFQSNITGNLVVRFGPGHEGIDITLSKPMLDEYNGLRGYATTDPPPAAPAADPEIDFDFVPNRGWYEGAVHKVATGNASFRMSGGAVSDHGWRMTMRRSGAIRKCQFQVCSNRNNGETSKSRVNGNNAHGYPASWQLGFRIYNANASWQRSGSPLRDIHFTYTTPDGHVNNSRVLFEVDVSDLAVSQGQRLLFLLYNRTADPLNNHPSVNMTGNGGGPPFGLNPPRAASIFWGDDPVHTRGGATLGIGNYVSTCSFGLRYADGYEEGNVGFDSTIGVFLTDIGGSNRVRQRWSSPYWRRASQIALAVYRRPNLMPQAALTVQISGPDISTMSLNIPASQIQVFDGAIPSSYTYTHQTFALPGDLLLSPSSVYTVVLSSPGSGGDRYRIHGFRHYIGAGLANSANASANARPPSGPIIPIEPHKWSGDGMKSSNGGSSWEVIGWAGGGCDLPIALVTNRRMAKTLEALPD